jgi:FixJ family two-component response regulator
MLMGLVEGFYEDLNELRAHVEVLKSELYSLEATGISAMNLEKVGTSYNISKPTEMDALNLIGRRKELEEKITVIYQRLEILDGALKALTNFEFEIIKRKVIDGEPFYRICGDMKISERNARRTKARALVKLERTIYYGKRIIF